MTPDTPPAAPPPRPGIGVRRQALGRAGTKPSPPARESLRAALARIPDLDETTTPASASVAAPARPAPAPSIAAPVLVPAGPAFVAPAAPPAVDPAAPLGPAPGEGPADPAEVASGDAGSAASVAAPVAASVDDRPKARVGSPRPPMWRRVVFGIALVGLVAAIPVLAYAGAKVIAQSTAGNFDDDVLSPTSPGYEAQVDPTPTAAALQFDDEGNPNGITFMSLAGDAGGGSVVFVPLDTEVSEPSYGVDTLRTAFDVVKDRPALARERLASQTGRVMTVGVDEIIDLGTTGWEQLVAPVAPLEVENPDAVTLPDGTVIPAGTVPLQADQVAPYLAATKEGESDLTRLTRHEALWRSWLAAVAASGQSDAVPGEESAGIGRFARELARGPISYATLPVAPSEDTPNLFLADDDAVNDLVTETIAAPTAPVPGGRYTVRLLNGVEAGPVPSDVVRDIVRTGGAVSVVGNGPEFGTEQSTVVYANPEDEQLAEVIASSLGVTGEVRLDREAPDTVDLTIVLGKDILGD
jgi:hypothetical protein